MTGNTEKCFLSRVARLDSLIEHQTHHHFSAAHSLASFSCLLNNFSIDDHQREVWNGRIEKKNSFHSPTMRVENSSQHNFSIIRNLAMKSLKFSIKLVHDQYVANALFMRIDRAGR